MTVIDGTSLGTISRYAGGGVSDNVSRVVRLSEMAAGAACCRGASERGRKGSTVRDAIDRSLRQREWGLIGVVPVVAGIV